MCFRIFRTRLHLMLDEDNPLFENWDQDKTAVEDRYGEQDPGTVAAELASAGEAIANDFAQVPQNALERRGRRSNGSVFTVATLGLYFVHDPVHHLHDVSRLPAD